LQPHEAARRLDFEFRGKPDPLRGYRVLGAAEIARDLPASVSLKRSSFDAQICADCFSRSARLSIMHTF